MDIFGDAAEALFGPPKRGRVLSRHVSGLSDGGEAEVEAAAVELRRCAQLLLESARLLEMKQTDGECSRSLVMSSLASCEEARSLHESLSRNHHLEEERATMHNDGYCWSDVERLGVRALLIDLDGTMYTPHGLIDGAEDFYAYLRLKKIPFCFVSNTGAKGAKGVQAKLARLGKIMFKYEKVPLAQVVTAAETQAKWMVEHLPNRAKIFVVAGGENNWWKKALSEVEGGAKKVRGWDMRTKLSESEATAWAAASAASARVFVALFSDGQLADHVDPKTGERGHVDWSFDVIKKASYLLAHKATLICTAEDAWNPSVDPEHPSHVFPLPGPGMFSAMFRRLMYPSENVVVVGKGGDHGTIIDEGLHRLRDQGFCGTNAEIMIVGDRYDTDCLAGKRAGMRTCLVESGAHDRHLHVHYPHCCPVDLVVKSVKSFVPPLGQSSLIEALDLARSIERSGPEPSYSGGGAPAAEQEEEDDDDEASGRRSLSSLHELRPSPRRALSAKLQEWTLRRGFIKKAETEQPLASLSTLLTDYYEAATADTGRFMEEDLDEALEKLGLEKPAAHRNVARSYSLAEFAQYSRTLLAKNDKTFDSEKEFFSSPSRNQPNVSVADDLNLKPSDATRAQKRWSALRNAIKLTAKTALMNGGGNGLLENDSNNLSFRYSHSSTT